MHKQVMHATFTLGSGFFPAAAAAAETL